MRAYGVSLIAYGTAYGCVATAFAFSPAQPDAQTFRSGVDYVLVDVAVRQGGRPVTDLSARDFVLYDAGVEQKVERVSREAMPIDMTLIVDWSGSVDGAVLRSLTRGIDAVQTSLRPADHATVITFNHAVRDRGGIPAGGATAETFGRPSGQTSLIDAATLALIREPQPGRRHMAILFTDGIDTTSFTDATSLLDVARRTETAVFVVALTQNLSRTNAHAPHEVLFSKLADTTGGALTILHADEELGQSFVRAFEEFRTSYVLSYAYDGPAREGWHPVSVRVTRRGEMDIRARQGYFRAAPAN